MKVRVTDNFTGEKIVKDLRDEEVNSNLRHTLAILQSGELTVTLQATQDNFHKTYEKAEFICHCGKSNFLRGSQEDPWDSRLDYYCYECSLARCDAPTANHVCPNK